MAAVYLCSNENYVSGTSENTCNLNGRKIHNNVNVSYVYLKINIYKETEEEG